MSETVAASGRSLLRVSQVWGDEVMADRVLTRPCKITVGAHRRCTFIIPSPVLPKRFAIIRPRSKDYVLTIAGEMTGTVCLGGKRTDVAEFLAGGDRDGGSSREAALSPGDWGVIDLDGSGDHTLFFQFVPAETPLPRKHMQDAELLRPAFAFSLVLHGILLIVVFALVNTKPTYVFPGDREFLAGYLIERPPPPLPVARGRSAAGSKEGSKKVKKPAATAQKAGHTGGHGKEHRRRTHSPKHAKHEIPPQIRRGLLTRRSRKAMESVLRRANFNARLGTAISRLQGRRLSAYRGRGGGHGSGLGAGTGTGTRTRGGTGGPGGGGHAHAGLITHGAINTGGIRAPHGNGGKRIREVAVAVKVGHPRGDFGSLTAAQINKVVMSRRNAIRACYEHQLQRHPHLRGKVVILWRIGEAGQVTFARVKRTTVHNGSVEDCIVRQVRSMHFPHPRGGTTAIVSYPFLLTRM